MFSRSGLREKPTFAEENKQTKVTFSKDEVWSDIATRKAGYCIILF